MKGQVNVVWIAGASLLAIIGVLSFSLAYQVQSAVRGLHERNVVEAINEIEFVKKTLHQSLIYSTYQSSYEILKFGEYPTVGCDPENFDGLPYWRTNEETCPPNSVKVPLENKLNERFGEYLIALQDKVSKINIEIPSYAIELTTNDDNIDVIATSNNRLKLKVENLEISSSGDIVKTVGIPVNSLLKIGKEHFIAKDSIKEIIQQSDTEMISTDYDGSLRNCKEIIRESCDSSPTKEELLDSHCPNAVNKFESKIESKLDAFYVEDDTIFPTLIPESIESSVDKRDESTCSTSPDPNHETCACISWSCSGVNQVKVGDIPQFKNYGEAISVAASDSCTNCVERISEIVDNTVVSLCKQWSNKICPSGSSVNETHCFEEVNPQCPNTGKTSDGTPCLVASYVAYHNHCHSIEDASLTRCPTNSAYTSESSDFDIVTFKADATCPSNDFYFDVDTDTCIRYVRKICPSGTKEFGNTGRCYKIPSVAPNCDLKETLYTKTCNYNYQASVNVLVNIKDEKTNYPVYDSVEQKTDMRNLELQFYVLSKN